MFLGWAMTRNYIKSFNAVTFDIGINKSNSCSCVHFYINDRMQIILLGGKKKTQSQPTSKIFKMF